jgi:hypothetical protein
VAIALILCLLAGPALAKRRATPPEPVVTAQASAPAAVAQPPVDAGADDPLCAPLLLDSDYGFGAHVIMRRLPNAADIEDLRFVEGFRQLVISLPAWPTSYAELKPLQQAILPDGSEVVVLLPGWPPSREALNAWNLIGGALRVIIVVPGPPADRALIQELNRMRPLERVIAQMEHPSRSGFERLQRPLSFRVLHR